MTIYLRSNSLNDDYNAGSDLCLVRYTVIK